MVHRRAPKLHTHQLLWECAQLSGVAPCCAGLKTSSVICRRAGSLPRFFLKGKKKGNFRIRVEERRRILHIITLLHKQHSLSVLVLVKERGDEALLMLPPFRRSSTLVRSISMRLPPLPQARPCRAPVETVTYTSCRNCAFVVSILHIGSSREHPGD